MQPTTRPLAAALLAVLFVAAAAAEPQREAESGGAVSGPGQRAVDPAAALDELAAHRRGGAAGRGELAGPPSRLPLEWEDAETRAAYLAAVRAYYDYRTHGLRHRSGVFAWQLVSSKVIFVVVVLLVLSGVYFSGVQFHTTLRAWKLAAARQEEGGTAAGPAPLGGELEAGVDRLKVSSPVLGVIILALSFLFFYLYIVHVHPIEEIL